MNMADIKKKAPTRKELLEDALAAKRQEQIALNTIILAKASDKDGRWEELLSSRMKSTETMMHHLDSTASEFKFLYKGLQCIRGEYALLLRLLANPEKRAKKVENEIIKFTKELEELKKKGEALGQY